MAIQSFRDQDTEAIFRGETPRGMASSLARQALRKLQMIDRAQNLLDLRSPPGNRLEALRGSRAGQFSVRVNDQYRICFRWDGGARDVEFVDYH